MHQCGQAGPIADANEVVGIWRKYYRSRSQRRSPGIPLYGYWACGVVSRDLCNCQYINYVTIKEINVTSHTVM